MGTEYKTSCRTCPPACSLVALYQELWEIPLIDNGGELACISQVHACLNSGRYLINLGAQDGLITFLLLGSRTEKET
jgi:hypothetical protein